MFRGMTTLAIGSGIGRVIGIAAIPILTRLYTPTDFGVLAVFTALIAIFAPLVTLRYVQALPLPRHDGAAANLLVVSAGLMLVLSALVAIVLWLWGTVLLGIVSMEVLAPWWWLISLGVLGSACYEMLTLWATRRRAYKVIAQTSVTQSIAGAAVKIMLGLMSIQPLGLLLGQVVAQAGGIGRLLREFMSEFRSNWHHVRIGRMRKAAWQHRGFPKYLCLSGFMMVSAVHAPVLILSKFYSTADVGNLGMALMLISIPATTFAASIQKAHFAEASRIRKKSEQLYSLTRSVLFKTIIISILPSLSIIIAAPLVIPIFLGEAWRLGGILSSILAMTLLTQMASQAVVCTLNVIDRNGVFLYFNVIRLVVVTVVLIGAPAIGASITQTVFAYAVTITLHRLGQAFVVLQILKSRTLIRGEINEY